MSYLGEHINWQRCKRPLPSIKYDMIDPEKQDKQQINNSEDPKMILLTASRAKQKLRQTVASKMRALSSNSSRDCTAIFSPKMTISKMIRDRHTIEHKSQKLQNTWGFISQRFEQQNKKKQFLKKKQEKLRQTIRSNQSFKLFVEETLQSNSQRILQENKQSKTIVLNQRKNLNGILTKARFQKTICGEIGRKQSQLNYNQIKEFKNNISIKNKVAYQKGRSLQQNYHKNKVERFNSKKKMAQRNYKDKWMRQFIQKQKAQKHNKMREKVLTKKIENLLKQTQKIRQNNLSLSQTLFKK